MNTDVIPTTEIADGADTLVIDESAATSPGPESAPAPRTRWAAIIWGIVFAIVAWIGIVIVGSADRRADVADWFADLTTGTITAVSLLAAGILVLIAGLVGLIRRAQKRLDEN